MAKAPARQEAGTRFERVAAAGAALAIVGFAMGLAAAAAQPDRQTVTGAPGGVTAGTITGGTFNQFGLPPAEQLQLTEIFSQQIAVGADARAKAEARAAELAAQLGFTREAVIGFFRIVGERDVPAEQIPVKLGEVAARHRALMERWSVLDAADIGDRGACRRGQGGDRRRPLRRGGCAAAARARAGGRGRPAGGAVGARRAAGGGAALAAGGGGGRQARGSRGGRYRPARAPDGGSESPRRADGPSRPRPTNRAADPLGWATAQNNLGIALQTLGAREAGTAMLEAAVAAFRAALEERTRERVPLDWALTQIQSRQRARGAWASARRDGAAGGGGRGLPGGAAGVDPRAGAARVGD